MGRKKITRIIEEQEPEEVTPTPADPATGDGLPVFAELTDDDLPDDLYGVMQQFTDTYSKIIVHKTDRGGKSPYLTTVLPGDFDSLEQYIADHFGGGRYIAKLYGVPSGGTRAGILKAFTFWIDESVKPLPPEVVRAAATPAVEESSLVAKLLEKALDRGSQKDPMEIAAALAAASAAQVKNSLDVLTPLLDRLLGKRGDGMDASELLEAVKLGVSLSGEGGEGAGWMGLAEKVGVPLVEALKDGLNKGGTVAPKAIPPTAAAAAAAGKPPWYGMLRPYVLGILPYIQTGQTPELVAKTVDLQAPQLGAWLETAVEQPAFGAQLLDAFPELQPHREWVGRFLAEFGEALGPVGPGNTVTAQPAEPAEGDDSPIG